MKQKIYSLGLASVAVISLGAVFKINHWPGAGIMLMVGMTTLAVLFIPLALWSNYKSAGNKQNLILYIATFLTCFVVFIGMLFKIQHWPGAGIWLVIALPFPYLVFLPVYLIVTGRNKNFNIYNTVYVLFLLAGISVISLLLALNVSKERIADTLFIAGNYNRFENAIDKLPPAETRSDINQKIDNLLKTIGEYKDVILKMDELKAEQWNIDPQNYMSSKALQVNSNKVMDKANNTFRKLRDDLSDLIMMLSKTPEYTNLAKKAPGIFDMSFQNNKFYNFNSDFLFAALQPWNLIYLEALETNLKLIKLSLKD